MEALGYLVTTDGAFLGRAGGPLCEPTSYSRGLDPDQFNR